MKAIIPTMHESAINAISYNNLMKFCNNGGKHGKVDNL